MKNNLFGKSLVTVESLKREDIESIFKRADEMKSLVETQGGDERLKGKIMGALFFEPSSLLFRLSSSALVNRLLFSLIVNISHIDSIAISRIC